MLQPLSQSTPLRSKVPGWLNPYVLAILLLPALVLWGQDNSLFPAGGIDSWLYLGFFRNLAEFQRELLPGTYYGSRLSWILPGNLIHALVSPVPASAILHLAVHSVAVLSLFATLRRAFSGRRAFLTAILFSLNPLLWRAIGWDYVDGPGIAYCLLAFACFQRAVTAPRPRIPLMAAGACLAALVYTNLYWATLAPLLPMGLLPMARTRVGASWKRLLIDLSLWTGAGFTLATIALCCVNLAIGGHFWFYGPSVHVAAQLAGEKNRWFQRVWEDRGLQPHLWFAAAAAVIAVRILLARPWKKPGVENVAMAVFSGQLLCASAWMGITQARGIPVLGVYYYASYLLPSVFLVIGAGLPAVIDKLAPKTYALLCGAAALVLAAVWADRTGTVIPCWPAGIPQMALLAGATMALSQFLRNRAVAVVLALAGFAVLTAEVRTRQPADPHSNRQRFAAIMQVRSHIEAARQGRHVRFWYDEHDAHAEDFTALSSTYLGLSLPKDDVSGPAWCLNLVDTLLVSVSSSADSARDAARQLTSRCFAIDRPRAEPMDVVRVNSGDADYTAAILPVEPVLHLEAAPQGSYILNPIADPSAPVSLPLADWSVMEGGTLTEIRRTGASEMLVHTPRGTKNLAALYPPMTVRTAGLYQFAVRYRPEGGHFVFAAKDLKDVNSWLAGRAIHRTIGSQREAAFWLYLVAGQRIQLALINDNESDASVSFRMTRLFAVRLLTPGF